MGANYYFKDKTTEKYLLYTMFNGKEHIHGEYGDLKSLSAAITWLGKYEQTRMEKYRIRKVKVIIEDITMTEEEINHVTEVASKKGVSLDLNKN